MRLGDTPVPIPNTMVKTQSADGTIPETVWESRWMPVHCFLGEDERKRSLRLENKHTLRSEAKQWCYLNKILMRTSEAKFELRKIAHLIERSEMMVLPSYFLAKTSESEV